MLVSKFYTDVHGPVITLLFEECNVVTEDFPRDVVGLEREPLFEALICHIKDCLELDSHYFPDVRANSC